MSDTASVSRTKFDVGEFFRTYSILFILIGFVIFFTILTEGRFFATQNLMNLVVQVAPIGIISLGMMAAIITKGIDLSVGSTVAFVSVIVAAFAQRPGPGTLIPGLPAMPIFVSLLVGLLAGALVGGTVGSLIAIFKIPPFIATLGMMTAARGFANIITNGRPVSNLAPGFTAIGQGVTPIIILVLLAVLMWFIYNRTRFGRHIYAIGGNEMAAKVSGISVAKNHFKIYTMIGLLAAVAAIVLTARNTTGNPGFGVMLELDVITATVIGGTSFNGGVGTVWGVMVGTLIIGVINVGLTMLGVSPFWQMVVKGAIIILAIIIDERKNRRR